MEEKQSNNAGGYSSTPNIAIVLLKGIKFPTSMFYIYLM